MVSPARLLTGLHRGLAIATGAALLFAAFAKLVDIRGFAAIIAQQGVFPPSMSFGTAVAWMCFESAAGLWAVGRALVPSTWRSAFVLPSVGFGALAIYVWLVAVSPPEVPTTCGCLLSSAPVTDWHSIAWRDTALFAAGVLLTVPMLRARRSRARQAPTGSGSRTLGAVAPIEA